MISPPPLVRGGAGLDNLQAFSNFENLTNDPLLAMPKRLAKCWKNFYLTAQGFLSEK